MIASLRGRIVDREVDCVTVDVNGVGYRVFVPLLAMSELIARDGEVHLRIHTHVREDALLLYGFGSVEQRGLFRLLLSISGVGPKLALNVLGGMELADLIDAIRREDSATLSRIPGVGKKTAERLCYELKEKLPRRSGADLAPQAVGELVYADLCSALVNLGYKPKAVDKVVLSMRDADVQGTLQQLLREALKRLR